MKQRLYMVMGISVLFVIGAVGCASTLRCPPQYILLYERCYLAASIPTGYQVEPLRPMPYPYGVPPLAFTPYGYYHGYGGYYDGGYGAQGGY